jgi:hypothetical protein
MHGSLWYSHEAFCDHVEGRDGVLHPNLKQPKNLGLGNLFSNLDLA